MCQLCVVGRKWSIAWNSLARKGRPQWRQLGHTCLTETGGSILTIRRSTFQLGLHFLELLLSRCASAYLCSALLCGLVCLVILVLASYLFTPNHRCFSCCCIIVLWFMTASAPDQCTDALPTTDCVLVIKRVPNNRGSKILSICLTPLRGSRFQADDSLPCFRWIASTLH